MQILFASSLIAGHPGAWDCIGFTDMEIMLAYDDSVGLPNCDRGEPGSVGASGSPACDSNPDGPGAHG